MTYLAEKGNIFLTALMITMIESYPNIPPVASRAKLFPIVEASNDPPDMGKNLN